MYKKYPLPVVWSALGPGGSQKDIIYTADEKVKTKLRGIREKRFWLTADSNTIHLPIINRQQPNGLQKFHRTLRSNQ